MPYLPRSSRLEYPAWDGYVLFYFKSHNIAFGLKAAYAVQ